MQQQITKAMLECGIDPPGNIIIDGDIHRFSKDKSCWYVFFPAPPVVAGSFGHGQMADGLDKLEFDGNPDLMISNLKSLLVDK